MILSLLLETLVAVLLLATIAYCYILNRRLESLRGAQSELRGLIAEFNRATEQARAGVAELKAAGEQAGRALQDQVDGARSLRDELAFINEAGGKLADRLVEGMDTARRQGGRAPGTAGAGAAAPGRETPAGRSEMERELLQALHRVK